MCSLFAFQSQIWSFLLRCAVPVAPRAAISFTHMPAQDSARRPTADETLRFDASRVRLSILREAVRRTGFMDMCLEIMHDERMYLIMNPWFKFFFGLCCPLWYGGSHVSVRSIILYPWLPRIHGHETHYMPSFGSIFGLARHPSPYNAALETYGIDALDSIVLPPKVLFVCSIVLTVACAKPYRLSHIPVRGQDPWDVLARLADLLSHVAGSASRCLAYPEQVGRFLVAAGYEAISELPETLAIFFVYDLGAALAKVAMFSKLGPTQPDDMKIPGAPRMIYHGTTYSTHLQFIPGQWRPRSVEVAVFLGGFTFAMRLVRFWTPKRLPRDRQTTNLMLLATCWLLFYVVYEAVWLTLVLRAAYRTLRTLGAGQAAEAARKNVERARATKAAPAARPRYI